MKPDDYRDRSACSWFNSTADSKEADVRNRRWLDYFVYIFIRVFVSVVQACRIETCWLVARGLALLFGDGLKVRAAVVDENLQHAYPELSSSERRALARRMWEHLFLMVAEIAHARRKIHATNWHQHIRLRDAQRLARLLLDDRPIVLVSGHYGNFEMSCFFLGLFGFSTYAIARRLDNPYLHRFVDRFRGASGQFMLDKTGSARQIALLLQRGATLALLGDQHAGYRGCWVEFFGRPASTHKAIAVFCLSAGAPLVVTYSRRLDKPLSYETGIVGVADPADPEVRGQTIPELTQWYTDRLEEMINVAPDQYWWVHRRWKGPVPARYRPRDRRAA